MGIISNLFRPDSLLPVALMGPRLAVHEMETPRWRHGDTERSPIGRAPSWSWADGPKRSNPSVGEARTQGGSGSESPPCVDAIALIPNGVKLSAKT